MFSSFYPQGTGSTDSDNPDKSLDQVSKALPRALWYVAVFLKQRPRRVAKFVQQLLPGHSCLISLDVITGGLTRKSNVLVG